MNGRKFSLAIDEVDNGLDDHAPTWRPGVSGVAAEAIESFKGAFRRHPAGVAVITADPGEGPVGLTATSVFSVSAEPPLVAFSVSRQSSAAPSILRSSSVVVHLVESISIEVARLCATSGIDRFADTTRWSRFDSGEPYFLGVGTLIKARIVKRVSAGGSVIIVAEAIDTAIMPDGDSETFPLVYHDRSWHELTDTSRIE